MNVMRIKVTKAEVHGWSTSFTLHQINGSGEPDGIGMSTEGLIHELGNVVGRHLDGISGMELTIIIDDE